MLELALSVWIEINNVVNAVILILFRRETDIIAVLRYVPFDDRSERYDLYFKNRMEENRRKGG